MAGDKSSNLALLIDGDNVSPKIIGGLMAEVANYGTASVRRIYGDWTKPDLKGWKACLLDNSISPIQQFAYTTGKNSTDGAMIIDAMDLLYTDRFAGFCLVSSDSDFTRLAVRIREQGLTVYGFGARGTSHALMAACNTFVYFDVLNTSPEETSKPVSTIHTSPIKPAGLSFTPKLLDPGVQRKPLDQVALDGLTMAINNCVGDDGEWANLTNVGDNLRKISPDLIQRNYGYARLKDFVEASGIATVEMRKGSNKEPYAVARLKKRPTSRG